MTAFDLASERCLLAALLRGDCSEDIIIIWARKSGGSDQRGSGAGGKKWLDSGCISEIEWIVFAED